MLRPKFGHKILLHLKWQIVEESSLNVVSEIRTQDFAPPKNGKSLKNHIQMLRPGGRGRLHCLSKRFLV